MPFLHHLNVSSDTSAALMDFTLRRFVSRFNQRSIERAASVYTHYRMKSEASIDFTVRRVFNTLSAKGRAGQVLLMTKDIKPHRFSSWLTNTKSTLHLDEYQISKRFTNTSVTSIDEWNDILANTASKAIMQKMFLDLLRSGSPKVNEHTLTLILPSVEHYSLCCLIHSYAMKNALYGVRVKNFLMAAYTRCASIMMAVKVFDEVDRAVLNVYSYNSLIYAYGAAGMGKEALLAFNKMRRAGFKPNEKTWLAVLFACDHSLLNKEAIVIFLTMFYKFGMKVDLKHYNCMIDVIARTGSLEEAYQLILMNPIFLDKEHTNSDLDTLWGTLVENCTKFNNVSLGLEAFKRISNPNGAHIKMWRELYLNMNCFDEAGKISEKIADFGSEHSGVSEVVTTV